MKCSNDKLLTLSPEEIVEHITKTNIGHEAIYGCVVPYYDFEKDYKTLAQQKKNFITDLENSRTLINEKLGEFSNIIAFSACGKKDEGVYRNSFHFIVRNVGFYTCSGYVPKIMSDGFDQAVYTNSPGKRHLFRLPYTSKDGKTRFLKRIGSDNMVMDMNEAIECDEVYEDWLVTNIRGERLIDTVIKDSPIGIKLDTGDNIITKEGLISLLDCFLKNNSQNLPWDEWIRVIWATLNTCHSNGIEHHDLIHNWCMKSDKYEKHTTQEVINRACSFNGSSNQLRIGSLIKMAKKHNLDDVNAWFHTHMKKPKITRRDPYVWFDFYAKYKNMTFECIEDMWKAMNKDLPRVISRILCGGGFIVKKEDLEDKTYNIVPGFSMSMNNFKISFKELKAGKKDKVTGNVKNVETTSTISIFNILEKVCPFYSNLDFDPSENKKNILNIWDGIEAEEVDEIDMSLVQPWLDFLYEVKCDSNDELFEYDLNVKSFQYQNIGIPCEKASILIGKPGSGKNTEAEFESQFMYGKHCSKTLTGLGQATHHFNSIMMGQKYIVVNEMCTNKDEFRSNFEALKTYITDKTIPITIKGKDTFNCTNATNWTLISNHWDCFIIETGDRRYVVYKYSDKHANNTAYFKELRQKCFNQNTANHFYTYIMRRKIVTRMEIETPPMTPLRKQMMSLSKASWEHFIEECQIELSDKDDDKDDKDDENKEDIDNYYDNIDNCLRNIVDVIPKDRLYRIYADWCKLNNYRAIGSKKFKMELVDAQVKEIRYMKQRCFKISTVVIQ
jgi:hypothetical protein